jgi:adenylate cyclase
MSETRKLAAILCSDVVGYSRLAGADEDRILARLRALRSDLIDPTIAVHHGRIVKRTGDGAIVEFRSAVDAVRCAIEVQNAMVERNAGVPEDRRIVFRIGIHIGDVVEEADGDLMGDGVNIAARLEGIAKPGAICLSEDAYRQVKSRLDLKVSDLGATSLKNIAEPMRVYSLEVGAPAKADSAQPAPPADPPKSVTPAPTRRRPPFILFAAGVAVVLLLALGAWQVFVRGGSKSTEAAHLSIVVLPFANLSGDPAQDYFADGVTENLTTDLSRIRNSFVIARNTAFTYKGKSVDAKEIGKELGVRYVLEGSVQRDQSRVRVNAQLIDAETGAHLWADRFKEELVDLFKLQDQVVARLANALDYELVRAEAEKGRRSTDADSIDLTMRGWGLLNVAGRDKERYRQARELFERALERDPENPDALVGVALIDIRAQINGWVDRPDITFEGPLRMVTQALTINRDYAFAYYVRSLALWASKRLPEALEAARDGTNFDANSAFSFFGLAQVELSLARCDDGLAHVKQALRLNPRDPAIGLWRMNVGIAEMCHKNFDAAAQEIQRGIDGGFGTFVPYAMLAAAEALRGNVGGARTALAEARRQNPLLTIKWFATTYPTTQFVIEGFRKAGMPEE